MTRLLLIKHALPALDPARPANTWTLSAEGEARCAAFAHHLHPYRLSELVASLEPKAQRTAELLAQSLNLPWRSAPNLHEHERQLEPYHGKDAFEQRAAALFARPDELVFGSETARTCLQRFQQAVSQIQTDNEQEQDVCIVAHGTVISLYCAACAGVDGFALWQQLTLPSLVVLHHNQIERITLWS